MESENCQTIYGKVSHNSVKETELIPVRQVHRDLCSYSPFKIQNVTRKFTLNVFKSFLKYYNSSMQLGMQRQKYQHF